MILRYTLIFHTYNMYLLKYASVLWFRSAKRARIQGGKVKYKSRNIAANSNTLNMGKSVHTRFDSDGNELNVKPSRTLSKVKRFLVGATADSSDTEVNEADVDMEVSEILDKSRARKDDTVSEGCQGREKKVSRTDSKPEMHTWKKSVSVISDDSINDADEMSRAIVTKVNGNVGCNTTATDGMQDENVQTDIDTRIIPIPHHNTTNISSQLISSVEDTSSTVIDETKADMEVSQILNNTCTKTDNVDSKTEDTSGNKVVRTDSKPEVHKWRSSNSASVESRGDSVTISSDKVIIRGGNSSENNGSHVEETSGMVSELVQTELGAQVYPTKLHTIKERKTGDNEDNEEENLNEGCEEIEEREAVEYDLDMWNDEEQTMPRKVSRNCVDLFCSCNRFLKL